ncbi:MAG: DUF1501 domain-containing protein [Planctomycetales bacterium]|nr:DUF1501 domain-containing protein [Planctomycetales bacterium]
MTAAMPSLMRAAEAPVPSGKADSCIFIWLGGGACHVDTFDPKRKSTSKKDPGSYYDSIETAIPGVRFCEHLPQLAKLAGHCVPVRTVNHDVIDEHAAATNRLHTGRPPTGTTVYPSIGAVMSHELGARGEGVPPYVLMGYPSPSRGPGFLGAKHSYLYLIDTEAGPAGLRSPVRDERQQRRQRLLEPLVESYRRRTDGDQRVADYADTQTSAFQLAGPKFAGVFDLKSEAAELREQYGGEFGQRCLLARRLVEEGVRFVEVAFNLNFINGTGWDTHNDGQLNQHLLIRDLDQAMSALLVDLERRGRLDKTLVVVATEFGRPPEFDGGHGRGHYSKAFSCVLAGGGLRTGQAVGVTDELGKKILEQPVSVPDFHATIYAALGVDPHRELYDGVRPVPITDRGTPIASLF